MAKFTISQTDYSFTAMQGMPTETRETLRAEDRQGVDGTEFTRLGTRGAEFSAITWTDVADASTAATLCRTYEGIVGNVTTVTDGAGQTHANIVILDVRAVPQRADVYGGLVAGALYLVVALWTLRHSG